MELRLFFSSLSSYFSLCFFFFLYSNNCKRCVVIYEKHTNVLQYKESECEDTQKNIAPQPISSIIRSDYNTDSRFPGNEQYQDPDSEYCMLFVCADELRLM